MSSPNAVVLLSGGLDSATILAVARSEGFACHCLSFDYGQRNRHELEAAKRVARHARASSHRIISVSLRDIGGSALTDDAIPVSKAGPGKDIPDTYVPARNTIFLSYGLALSEVVGASEVFIGVNSVDYSGYPDCRPEFIAAFQALAGVATKQGVSGEAVRIRAPLQEMGKCDIIKLGVGLGVDYALTLTCYDPVGEEGLACGLCDSCRLRRRGFVEAGVGDPTRYV